MIIYCDYRFFFFLLLGLHDLGPWCPNEHQKMPRTYGPGLGPQCPKSKPMVVALFGLGLDNLRSGQSQVNEHK